MKKEKLLFAFIAFASMFFIVAAFGFVDNSNLDDKGIVFFTGTWKEAVEKAQKEDKPIFLDVYARWCGPCKMMKKKTFVNKEAADFYNTNFINLTLDGEEGEGAQIAAQLAVSAYPTLFYFNKNGKPVLYSMGYLRPKELIEAGKAALRNIQ